MIKTISAVRVRDINDSRLIFDLPIIPSIGTFKTTEDKDSSGRFEQIDVSFRLDKEKSRHDILRKDLIAEIHFTDGTSTILGNPDFPVRFKRETSNTETVTCKYVRPVWL